MDDFANYFETLDRINVKDNTSEAKKCCDNTKN